MTVAMWYFWFNFDKSSWARKALWAVPLYFLVPIGPALYYFFVYLRNAEVTSLTAASHDVRLRAQAGSPF